MYNYSCNREAVGQDAMYNYSWIRKALGQDGMYNYSCIREAPGKMCTGTLFTEPDCLNWMITEHSDLSKFIRETPSCSSRVLILQNVRRFQQLLDIVRVTEFTLAIMKPVARGLEVQYLTWFGRQVMLLGKVAQTQVHICSFVSFVLVSV